MPSIEQVVTGRAELNDAQLQTVAEFLEFLRFHERRKFETQFEDFELETLYAEFADNDRELVETALAEYTANLLALNPVRGSEQAVTRRVLIMQTNRFSRLTTTVLTIPFTTNLRRSSLPSCNSDCSRRRRLIEKSVCCFVSSITSAG